MLQVASPNSCRWNVTEPAHGFRPGIRWQLGSCRVCAERRRELIPRPGHEEAYLAQRTLMSPLPRGKEIPAEDAITQMNIRIMNKILIITVLAAAGFAVGCNKEQTTSQQLDNLQTQTKQAAQDMKDYTFAQKAEFVAVMQTQLAALNGELDQLAAKVEKSSDTVKAETKPKLQALRDQTAQLHKQFDQVKNASESTWDSVKSGFNTAYASSKDGFNQARQWVSEKVAP
jgi:hypothetical protein